MPKCSSRMSLPTLPDVRLLTVCGSLQARSANRAALDAASLVAVAAGASVDVSNGWRRFLHSMQIGEAPIEVIDEWRRRVRTADVVLVATPEYAGGAAGA